MADRSCGNRDHDGVSRQIERKIMYDRSDELTNSLAQSVTRRGSNTKHRERRFFFRSRLPLFAHVTRRCFFGVGLAGMALSCWCLMPGAVAAASLGPLIELSQPNAVGTCDDGFRLPGTMTVDDAGEVSLAVNPANPNNVVAAWIQGPIQN